MKNKYEDIINLEHHISKKHPQMSISDRAAQFASFAALTGYEEEVEEAARITSRKIELVEEEKAILNRKIEEIQKRINNKPKITITYFIPDPRKDGGEYITVFGIVKKIDEDKKVILLENNETIPISEINDIVI